MIHFDCPWIFLMLPLPLLIRRLFAPLPDQLEAPLMVPFAEEIAGTQGSRTGNTPPLLLLWLAGLAWLLLVTAGAGPQLLGKPLELPVSGRDLLMAVDLSGSMEESDFTIRKQQVTRLTATKIVAGDFIGRRAGDRIGLLLFGSRPYLQVPLTFDRITVQTLLDEAVIGLAGKKTAIGDAIGLAVKRLRERPAENRVLILLTDGANTAGTMDPLKGAELAAAAGVKIYTIGIGADAMLVQSLFGTRQVNPSKDLDEETLQQIAAATGGRYFRARDTEELEKIYRLLDDLEPVVADRQFYRPQKALFHWPLGCGLFLAALLLILWRRQ